MWQISHLLSFYVPPYCTLSQSSMWMCYSPYPMLPCHSYQATCLHRISITYFGLHYIMLVPLLQNWCPPHLPWLLISCGATLPYRCIPSAQVIIPHSGLYSCVERGTIFILIHFWHLHGTTSHVGTCLNLFSFQYLTQDSPWAWISFSLF